MLPFHPTAAQKRALGEIVDRHARAQPHAPAAAGRRRLRQNHRRPAGHARRHGKRLPGRAHGAHRNSGHAALSSPRASCSSAPRRKPRIVLLTGSLDEDRKRTNRGLINRGEAQLVIGTHALIEEKVEFDRLGLVVVDEQHRFGVLQRFKLMKKPNQPEPDVLVMTATPIPRTLALSLYGDLDLSVLDELPPGRTPIVTRRVPGERAEEVWDFVRKQVAQGRQAYIVYPVIEGSERRPARAGFLARRPAGRAICPSRSTALGKDLRPKRQNSGAVPKARSRKRIRAQNPGLKSAVEMHEKLRNGPLAGLRVGLLHGRLDADEKEIIMRRFQRGEIDVLVATTVIEVGVDVPNATVMVVEHAERFGLAQLHQLRGRVGRGAAKSYCILITGPRVSPLGRRAPQRHGPHPGRLRAGRARSHPCAAPASSSAPARPACPISASPTSCATGKLLELAKQEAARFATRPRDRRPTPEASAPASARASKKPGSAATGWSKQGESGDQ